MAWVGASCQVAFDLDMDKTSLIFLESFPGVDDVVVFEIQPAYSLSNSAPRPDFKPEIVFTVNGKEIPVVQNTGNSISEYYLEDRYIAEYKPVPGDKMQVRVSSEGFESISAETIIPAPVHKRKIDFRKEEIGENEFNILYVTPESEGDAPYAYGMNIFKETTVYIAEDSTYVSTTTYNGYQISDYYEMSPVSFDGILVRYGFNNPILGVWQNTKEEQCVMSYLFDSYRYGGVDTYDAFFDHEGEYAEYDQTGNVIDSYRYRERNKLQLYTLTEEFYKYAIAQVLVDNADFPGIAPANFCYTNIVGGHGAFAGLTRVETDWITKEFIENNR